MMVSAKIWRNGLNITRCWCCIVPGRYGLIDEMLLAGYWILVGMSYLSIEFALSFFVFLSIYWLAQPYPRWQNALLLVGSYAFYCSINWRFALILAGYSCMIYGMGRVMAQSSVPRRWLTGALILGVGCLLSFKYLDFARQCLQSLLIAMGNKQLLPGIDLIMPVGISFYVFQSVTYLVSVYRREIKAARWHELALFLAFFPTLLAGPICRAKDLLAQLYSTRGRAILYPNRALMLILLALAKKLWLASWLASAWVDPVFAAPDTFHPLEVLAAFYAYALQIYLDFSGYTDLVTAIALLLGIHVPRNFNMPYLAVNLRDFWQRWHMSLSGWIRDYIYIPLGGNRKGVVLTQCNLMLAMLASGLWHGADVKYLIWGGLHGAGVVALNMLDRITGKGAISQRYPWLARLITFHYVCFAWVFFRAASLDDAWDFFNALWQSGQSMTMNAPGLLVLVAVWFVLLPVWHRYRERCLLMLDNLPLWSRCCVATVATLVIIELAPSGVPGFIYYQF